jgi:hypothetical protein
LFFSFEVAALELVEETRKRTGRPSFRGQATHKLLLVSVVCCHEWWITTRVHYAHSLGLTSSWYLNCDQFDPQQRRKAQSP